MFDVDQMMDLAISGVKNVFGRPVSYLVGGTAPGVALVGHYIREHVDLDPGTNVPISSTRDLLDFRSADLSAAGITPRKDDVVTFADGSTWRVLAIIPGDLGTTYLHIGRRSA